MPAPKQRLKSSWKKFPSFEECVKELERLLLGSNVPNEALVHAVNLFERSGQIVKIKPQSSGAVGIVAAEGSILLEPTDLLLHLITTARARDWKNFLVIGHEPQPL